MPHAAIGIGVKPFRRHDAESTSQTLGDMVERFGGLPAEIEKAEQQKVNLARALIQPYRLLLLDEPTASLDRVARRALIARFGELKAASVTMIGVFHFPEETQHLVDDIVTLDGPAGAADGTGRRAHGDVAQ